MEGIIPEVPSVYPKWVRVKGKAEGSEGYKQLVHSKAEENALLGLKNCEPEKSEPHAAPKTEETAEEGDADAPRRHYPAPAKKK